MSRSCLTLVSLLVVLTTVSGLAQTGEEFGIQRLPPVDQPFEVQPFQNPNPAVGEMPVEPSHLATPFPNPSPATGEPPISNAPITNAPISLDGSAATPPVATLRDFMGYRYETSSLNWIPGGANQFGMFSIAWDHYVKSGITSCFGSIGIGMDFNFLSGPVQTDMPPRVFDFSIAYQIRQQLGPLKFDLATSVLAASDFKGSARKGILFPSHGVGFLSVSPALDVVFGVDYLDRGDIKLLPVAGLIWTPNTQVRFELVFPRPRAVFQLSDQHRLYVAGELGGGTWAIERVTLVNDLATYRDLRVCVGLEFVEKGGEGGAIEIGYLFDRRLEYTSGLGDMRLDDAVMLRVVTRY
jgi:hypothetical protein